MDLDGLTLDEHRLECLNAEAVKRRGAVEQHGMVLDDFFKDVPHHRLLRFHHFFGLLDGGALAGLLEAVIDEWLEELERHLLRQSALIQLQFGADHDDGASGVVNALTEQVLAEAALLTLERVRKRFERTIVRTAQHATATTVVKEG